MKHINMQRGASVTVIAIIIATLALIAFYGYKSMSAPLLNTQWSWEYSDTPEGKVSAPDGDAFVITLGEDGRVTSTTDCNSMSGSFASDGEILSFGPFAMTKMYCEGSLEGEYARQLSLVASHVIEGRELKLVLLKDAGTMIFTKVR